MRNFFNLIVRGLPFIFWALIVVSTFLLLIPLAPKQGGFEHADKIIHATGFVILTLAGLLAFKNKFVAVCFGLAGYGILTELLQGAFTTTRLASVGDWLADVSGILIAALIFSLLKRYLNLSLHTE